MVVDDAGDIAGDGWGDDDEENAEDADMAVEGGFVDGYMNMYFGIFAF